ncbi:MAG: tRNA pseudouridine(55) synthase TruB, partial [Clostridia bacterium]|nr:tRNA pseudouridine(55) synthase TruB [Clostridia bacterium]
MTGFLNIFKEEGVSSAFVTNRIKWLCRTPSGHMGTLDPLASGVLPVGVGNATRLFDYFSDKIKTYTARFRFGATTETLDREGEIMIGGRIPSAAEIENALPE